MSSGAKLKFINGRAVGGYWGGGGGIRCRVNSELVADKVVGLEYDKIEAMGQPMALWLEASNTRSNLTVCSCYRDTAKQPDIPCLSCYGTGSIPGYFKFGTRTYWASPIEGAWTYAGTVLDKVNRPFRIQLDATSTTGTAISPNLTISETGKLGSWDYKFDGFTRDGSVNSSISIEASVDAGTTWFDPADLELHSPITQLQFKVTLTRTNLNVKSPMFEIVRARFPTMLDTIVNELNEPVIRVIQTWTTESELRQVHGSKLEAQGNTFWTLPLYVFDNSIPIDAVQSRIKDDTFVEVRYGIETGRRYALVNFSYSDQFGRFTRQQFSLRKASGTSGKNDGEIYARVW